MHGGAPAPNNDGTTRRPHPTTPRHSVPPTQPAMPHSSTLRKLALMSTKCRASDIPPRPPPPRPSTLQKQLHPSPSCKGQLPSTANHLRGTTQRTTRKFSLCSRMAHAPPACSRYRKKKYASKHHSVPSELSSASRRPASLCPLLPWLRDPPALTRVSEMAAKRSSATRCHASAPVPNRWSSLSPPLGCGRRPPARQPGLDLASKTKTPAAGSRQQVFLPCSRPLSPILSLSLSLFLTRSLSYLAC